MIRILIADDHIMLRTGLVSTISREADMEIVGEAEDGLETIQLFQELSPDVVVVDLRMPKQGGISTIKRLIEINKNAAILVYSNYASSDEITQSYAAGALGFVIKDMPPESLLEGIRKVNERTQFLPPEVSFRLSKRVLSQLSNREIDVLCQISKGRSNKEIASELNLAESTVKVHISNILSKLKVADRTQAVISALKQGLVEID